MSSKVKGKLFEHSINTVMNCTPSFFVRFNFVRCIDFLVDHHIDASSFIDNVSMSVILQNFVAAILSYFQFVRTFSF